ncbi:lipopolysaccharide biosynthesis protein [Lonsdalea iberica]|uniref:ECA polysaccharide chain length modulation protein n=1 Tax=Lonsdalea iberica TaxID=1082703 RepID=A0ABX3XF16_9GAMM|nr:ECA polysaccharide chain length modulation protein [Lonsdalea iberica]OSN10162.1 lipopolysaccharide biosynthesis protein [Lonsdalea iberica]
MSTENHVVRHNQWDNELDIRGLFQVLWRGKRWIAGSVVLFAALAMLYAWLAPQEWSATAITDKPTVNMLGGFYSQQQFLRNLDAKSFATPPADQPPITAEAYAEFVMQTAAYDTRRDFWLQSAYYRARQKGDARANAALLDELVNQIQFTPYDEAKKTNDSVKLTAETSADANVLLRQYVTFASQRAASHLNEALDGAWAARTVFMRSQIKQQESVAKAAYDRELHLVELALQAARQQGIRQNAAETPANQLPPSELFLLGVPMLQARLELLQASGPQYDSDYDRNRALLNTLLVGPVVEKQFQTYRYLRTPEEPVKRDSPRRLLLLVMWGSVGLVIGAGIALARRR